MSLQVVALLKKSTTVEINDANFGDPAPHWSKHFGAVVIVDGERKPFARGGGAGRRSPSVR